MHMRIDAMKLAAVVLTTSNCRETANLFANYTSSKGVSMKTVETPLDSRATGVTSSMDAIKHISDRASFRSC